MQITDADREAAEQFAGLAHLSKLQHEALERLFAAHREAERDRFALATAYHCGFEAGEKAERDRIVAWLREDAAKTKADFERLHKRGDLTNVQMWEWQRLIDWKVSLATAIEKGAHHDGK